MVVQKFFSHINMKPRTKPLQFINPAQFPQMRLWLVILFLPYLLSAASGSFAIEPNDTVLVENPQLLPSRLPVERIPVGNAGDYKPTIIELYDGTLFIAAFRQEFENELGEFHEDVVMYISTNSGKSWLPVTFPLDTLLGREAYLSTVADSIIFITTHMLPMDSKNPLGAVHSYLHRSSNKGETWTRLRFEPDSLPGSTSITTSRNVLELQDGSLLLAVSIASRGYDYIWKSMDQGKTWPIRYKAEIDSLPSYYPIPLFGEAKMLQTEDGTLYAIVRADERYFPPNPNQALPPDNTDQIDWLVTYRSIDEGHSWQFVDHISNYGEMYPSILRLSNDRLLLTYTVRALVFPLGLRAILGTEWSNGFSFDFDHDLVILEAKTPIGMSSGGGFGNTIQLQDETLISVYSYRDSLAEFNLEVIRWRAFPKTYVVSTTGNDSTGDGSTSHPFRHIQHAMSFAMERDTVLVQPGTYYENIIWPDVNGIKLISAGDSSNTTIDGGGVSSVIYMNPSATTIDSTTEIQGFKILNGGNVAYGGGMFVSNASPVLTRLWVTGNTATTNGGGLYIDQASPLLTNVNVSTNEAISGGGFYISDGSPSLTHVTAAGNIAGHSGGGLFINLNSPMLTDVIITGNSAGYGGGGYISNGTPILVDVIVTNNHATMEDGGGLYIEGGSPILTNMIVAGNTTIDHGGGFSIWASSPILTDVTVTTNTAFTGGGLYIRSSETMLTGVTVTDNIASIGGGLYIGEGSPTLTDIVVIGNTASIGGGLYMFYGSPILVNATITGNTSGIYIESGTPSITGSNIAHNGTGLHNADNTNIIDADSVWWGHSSGPYQPNQNPLGQGDSVNAFVDVRPVLTEPDTSAPPIPVQNLHATDTSATSISFAWDASLIGDLAGYRLYFNYDSSGFPYSDTTDMGINTAHTLENLLWNRIYYFAVTCYDDQGNESWYSNEISVPLGDFIAPTAPDDLSGVAGDSEVQLSWRPSNANDFGVYRIYGSQQPSPTSVVDSTGSVSDTTITISNLVNGTTYYFRVTAVDTLLNESEYSNEVNITPDILSVGIGDPLPTVFALHQNYPNPFNPVSTIRYDLPQGSEASLIVYDILGRAVVRLVDSNMEPGYHRAQWNGRDQSGRSVPSGIYIARLSTPEYAKSIKMLLLK